MNKEVEVKDLLKNAVRWNIPEKGIDGTPVLTAECKDHPAVRHTSYMEVYQILGTSGHSGKDPFWNWSVMGVIDMEHGKLVVCPGNWIITIGEGHYMVLKDETYKALCAQQSEGQEYSRPDL